jgi:hypothetical protein
MIESTTESTAGNEHADAGGPAEERPRHWPARTWLVGKPAELRPSKIVTPVA